jgi:hypothetical protein
MSDVADSRSGNGEMREETDFLHSFVGAVDDSKKRCAAMQAEANRIIKERQAGLDLLAQGIRKLIKVNPDYAKLSNSLENKTSETPDNFTTQLTSLLIGTAAVHNGVSVKESDSEAIKKPAATPTCNAACEK